MKITSESKDKWNGVGQFPNKNYEEQKRRKNESNRYRNRY